MNKAAETAKIPCAVCRDLMPLVQDGVASPESEALVKAHLAACPGEKFISFSNHKVQS